MPFTPPYKVNAPNIVPSIYVLGGQIGRKVEVRSGSSLQDEGFVAGSSGWQIDGDGNVEFNAGTFRGTLDAASGTFEGTLTAGSIDIPDAVTANSFHVESDGDTFWGATTLAAAPAKVNKDGSAEFTDLDLSGNLTMLTGGVVRTASSGQRVELAEATPGAWSGTYEGVVLFSGLGGELAEGMVGMGVGEYSAIFAPPTNISGSQFDTYLFMEAESGGNRDAFLQAGDGTNWTQLRLDESVARLTGGGSGGGLDWQDWSPTIDQGASTNIAHTKQYGQYVQWGDLVIAFFRASLTAGGTAGSAVTVDLPVTAVNEQSAVLGNFRVRDAAVTEYIGMPILASTTTVAGRSDGNVSNIGATPSYALTSGDTVAVMIAYRAA